MPQDVGGSTTFNVIDLTPFDASVEGEDDAPNLRTNSLQEGEDDAYIERETRTLEGHITRGRLKRIQEEDQITLGQGPFSDVKSYLAKLSLILVAKLVTNANF
ncbi:hypothetical protein CR513_26180, partial [Mucuna pruriens]